MGSSTHVTATGICGRRAFSALSNSLRAISTTDPGLIRLARLGTLHSTRKRRSFNNLHTMSAVTDSVLPWLLSLLSLHRWTEDAIACPEPALLCNLHVHIASVSLVVQLICSWCFCTCRFLMSARVGCEQILRRFGQAGEIRQGESPLYPRRYDRLRILCSALATNRKRPSDHDEDSSSYHDRSRCAFIKAGSRTSPSRTDRGTGRFEIDNPPC